MAIEELDLTQITGYAPEDRYLATRYTEGGRNVYDFELPLDAIPQIFSVPDPERPTLGNRRVSPAHARGFARYVRDNEHWVAPSLLMRAPEIFSWEAKNHISGVSFGILGVPRSKRRDIRIIDGQHRILGFHYAVEDIARELDEARARMDDAQRQGNPDLAAMQGGRVAELELQRQRLATEHLGVQVLIETDQSRYEQMFYDVADNALGITQAVKARFDSRKIMNRALDSVMRHSLLRDRVDLEQDRIGGQNPNLLGAAHAVDITRAVNLGIAGRVSRRQEDELDEGALVQRAHEFFDVLVDSFPELAAVTDESLSPVDLRKRSLLGSSTMLRILAGVYYELLQKNYGDEEIGDFFRLLSRHMDGPIAEGSPWLRIHSKVFTAGAMAPLARRQDLRSLTDEIASWVDPLDQPDWLAAA
ncbi:MAG: DNA sulfur modification protein DndB [Candidatus Limnocylindrales bacterium]